MAGSMCSYDNFPMFGAASYVSSLWLAALAHAVAAAKVLGDEAAAARYEEVLGKAQSAFEHKLWNGKYYRLYNDEGGAKGGVDEGCLTDQLCGEWALRLAGLNGLIPQERVRLAMREIVRRNTRYWGLRNCTWPGDKFVQPVAPENWGDQANICWSGTELCFASFLYYEGFINEATAIVAAVDQRYRAAGLYFDHQEFGGHYFRPMGAWAMLNALLGLTVNDGCYEFAPRLPDKNQKLFFAVPDATAHYVRRITGRRETVKVQVLTGSFTCRQLAFTLASGKRSKVSVNVDGTITRNDERVVIAFLRPLTLSAGETIEVCAIKE
jgi:hypothetical protein